MNYGTWSAWEKIDVDFSGSDVVPVLYNRKLYLFWLLFVEKPLKLKKQPPAAASTGPTDSPEAPKMLEIQLAWTERQDGGWSSRKASRQKLVHPWERPASSYHLKPRYKSLENLLATQAQWDSIIPLNLDNLTARREEWLQKYTRALA